MPRIKGNEYGGGHAMHCADCGDGYSGNKFSGVGRCPSCARKYAAQFIIYERGKGGSLPPNLRGKE
jgi:hypothetical protein